MTSTAVQSSRTIINSLLDVYTPPASCSVIVASCPSTCFGGWQAQTCTVFSYSDSVSNGNVDATNCWPPASSNAPTPTPPFEGWGFYSPGLVCPSGYSPSCTATASGSSEWAVQYSMTAGETAVGCCPGGYTCSVNAYGAQTCLNVAGIGATFPVITCLSGSSQGYSYLTLPYTATVSSSIAEITQYFNQAPMVEIRWRSVDLILNSTSSATTPSIPISGGSTTSPTSPASTSASPSGLSTGAEAAIGVVIPVVVILVALLGFLLWRRRRSKRQAPASPVVPNEPPGWGRGNGPHEMGQAKPPQEMDVLERPQEMSDTQRHELDGDVSRQQDSKGS